MNIDISNCLAIEKHAFRRACLAALALVAAAVGTVHFDFAECLKHGPHCRPGNIGQRAEWLAIDWAQGVGVAVGVLLDAGAAEHVALGGDGVEQRQGADRALVVLGDLGVVDIHVRLLGEPARVQINFNFHIQCLETREGLLEGRSGLGLLLAIEASWKECPKRSELFNR